MQKLKGIGFAVLAVLLVMALVAGAYVIYMIAAALVLLLIGVMVYKVTQMRAKWK